MAQPTPELRAGTFERDAHRCLSCGARSPLEYQHRQAVGMGGTKNLPDWADGITACSSCNRRYEADLQTLALAAGWKVRRNVDVALTEIPVYDVPTHTWFQLDDHGWRTPIRRSLAVLKIVAAYDGEFDVHAVFAADLAKVA